MYLHLFSLLIRSVKISLCDQFWDCQQILYEYKSWAFGTTCFISTIPVHFIHSNIKVSKYNFVFISLTFIFHIILQSFKETPFNKLLSGVMSLRGTKQRTLVIRESNFEGHKSPFWINVNLSDTFKTRMKLRNKSFCVTISRREKDRA